MSGHLDPFGQMQRDLAEIAAGLAEIDRNMTRMVWRCVILALAIPPLALMLLLAVSR